MLDIISTIRPKNVYSTIIRCTLKGNTVTLTVVGVHIALKMSECNEVFTFSSCKLHPEILPPLDGFTSSSLFR